MKSKEQIEDRLRMWRIILNNMQKHDDTEEEALMRVRVRIYEYLWVLEEAGD